MEFLHYFGVALSQAQTILSNALKRLPVETPPMALPVSQARRIASPRR